MTRIKHIVKIIKNVYYTTQYYSIAINKQKVNSIITNNIDHIVSNKFKNNELVKTIQLGFIELINYITTNLFAEYNQEQVHHFKFICCAYIDEFMYNHIGEKQWEVHLLEQHFFGTKISGERVIYDIVKFIEYHNQQEQEYSTIYYYMLCTGYLGIYKHDIDKVRTLKKEIVKIIRKEILFNEDDTNTIAPHIVSSVINTKNVENIKNYYTIYIRVLFIYLSFLMTIIFVVIYKGAIITKILHNAKP